MIRTYARILIVLLTAFLLLAPGARGAGTYTVAMEDNGKTLTVEQGSALEVKLSRPSSPGFAWDVLQNDATVLALEKRETVKDPNPFNAKSIDIFTFRATRSGTTTLKMYLHRGGETGELPGGNFAVTVNVSSPASTSSATYPTSPTAPTTPAYPATPTMTLTEANNGGAFILNSGSRLDVRLDYNAGTGFTWEIAENSGGVLAPSGSSDETVGSIPGANRVRVFSFYAKAAGTSLLKIHYLRPWEKMQPPARVFSVTITVNQASITTPASDAGTPATGIRVYPGNGETVSTSRPNVYVIFAGSGASAVNQSTIRLAMNGADVTNQSTTRYESISYVPPVDLPAGRNTAVVTALNVQGGSIRQEWSFFVGTAAATSALRFTLPVQGDTVGDSFDIAGYASPYAVVSLSVKVGVGGVIPLQSNVISAEVRADETGYFRYPFNGYVPVRGGTYTITGTAKNVYGQQSEPVSVTVSRK